MVNYPLGENNRNYIDEKELFIFYSLMKKRFISTWNEAFIPKRSERIHVTEEMKKDPSVFEEKITQIAKNKTCSDPQILDTYH